MLENHHICLVCPPKDIQPSFTGLIKNSNIYTRGTWQHLNLVDPWTTWSCSTKRASRCLNLSSSLILGSFVDIGPFWLL